MSSQGGYRNMGARRKRGICVLPENARAKLCLTNVVSHEIVKILLSAYSFLMTPTGYVILMAKGLAGTAVLHAGMSIPVAI